MILVSTLSSVDMKQSSWLHIENQQVRAYYLILAHARFEHPGAGSTSVFYLLPTYRFELYT